MSNIKHFFKVILRYLDKKVITPITKFFLWISDKTKRNSKGLERILTKKSSLILISLGLALISFFYVDTKSIILLETSADVIYNQKVTAIYNEEAYVIEGLPSKVDITLIGRKSDLYLAKQLPTHEVAIDLKGLKPGTHRVSLKYKGAIQTINYKLDPSVATVTIYPKVSEVRTVNVDILNKDQLDPKLNISKVDIDRQEVIVKGAEYKLKEVATVKALVDVNNFVNPSVGTMELKDVPLIAYDDSGNKMNIEMVPAKINATVTITSPSKTVPIKVIPTGETAFGKSISSITSSVNNITIYGDDTALSSIGYVPVEVDVTGLTDEKKITEIIKKPAGVRYMSENSTNIDVTVEDETTKEIKDIQIEYKNLSDNYVVQASSEQDMLVTVTVKGVKSVLDSIDPSSVKAYVDLNGYGIGTHDVDVTVQGSDLRATYVPKVKKVTVIISAKK